MPLAEFLAEHDIVVNCVLQDTDAPLMFVTDDDLAAVPPGSLIVDVSCDEGMGFEWARPTSFAEPMFTVGDDMHYYAVDHSPSYLWNSATWEISEALIPHLRTVMAGPGRLGRATRRSAGRSRSATASSRTPTSCRSSTARRSTRTGRTDGPIGRWASKWHAAPLLHCCSGHGRRLLGRTGRPRDGRAAR